MAETKFYVLRQNKKDTNHVFSGRSPRQAALKAATRNFKDIQLRERGRRNVDGTWSVHAFTGNVSKVPKPASAPAWLPAKINKPNVSKKGVTRIDKL